MDTVASPVTGPQLQQLMELLLAGRDPARAFAECGIAEGETQRLLSRDLEVFRAHPLGIYAMRAVMRLKCRDWLLRAYGDLYIGQNNSAIDEVQGAVPGSVFLSRYYWHNRPVIMRDAASHWPAIARWTADYLKQTCGSTVVEVMRNRAQAPEELQNVGRHLKTSMPFDEYVDLVYSTPSSNDFYIVSRNRFFENGSTKRLLDDIEALPFIDPSFGDGDVKMWFGPRGTVTKLHHDDRNNVIVQIAGRKTVRLYPAFEAPVMQQRLAWYAGADPEDAAPDTPLRERMEKTVIRLEIGPGDALFIPVGWWHALTALDPSITLAFVNFGVPNEFGEP